MPAEHLTAETDWTQLCAEAESVSADEQTAAYLEADEMDFASDAGEAPAADSSDDSSFDMLRAPLMRPTLLEASAGTGKTFSIKHLVLRFVAEEDVSVSRMLIMTFYSSGHSRTESPYPVAPFCYARSDDRDVR